MDLSLIFPAAALPALVLVTGALVAIVFELAAPPRLARAGVLAVTLTTLAAAAVAVGAQGAGTGGDRLAVDTISRLVYAIVLIAAFVGLAISLPAVDREEPGGFLALLLLASAGMGLLGSARTLPVAFIGLEMLSLSLYVLVAYHRRDERAKEAALKYFLLGSLASAVLLFGMAITYGATGAMDLPGIEQALSSGTAPGSTVAVGFALMLIGFAFKLALAPFHVWAPDAYEGAGLGVTAFMSVATKAAALAALIRFALVAPDVARVPLWVLAALSMLVGSLGALRQGDLRRLMAYSGIANAGYLLIALPGLTAEGIGASLFYLAAYALMNLGFFAAAGLIEPGWRRALPFEALSGAAGRRPLVAWAGVLFLLALTGMPLTGGFVGKVLLVGSAVREGATWLALFLVASTGVLAYPYLRLVDRLVRRGEGAPVEPEPGAPLSPAPCSSAALDAAPSRQLLTAIVVGAAVLTVLLGIWPETLLRLVRAS